jgi:hypothetical protein
MIQLEQELNYEIEWRTNELSILRLTPIKHALTEDEKRVLEKYSTVAIYSLWEGFVTQSFTLYIRTLNSQNLNSNNLHLNLITHDLDMKCNLRNERIHFEAKYDLVNFICQYQNLPIDISKKIPTESNVNFEVINKILFRFNLEPLPEKNFKKRLNKLLKIRNNIAHGECSIPVNRNIIAELISTVSDSMDAVANVIVDGYKNQKYLKNSTIPQI